MDYIKEISDNSNIGATVYLGKATRDLPKIEGSVVQEFKDFRLVYDYQNFYMEVDHIALFSIVNRNKVAIELVGNTTVDEALPFFYGTVLTALLHMHFHFPIHASAVLGKGGLNLFCAASGTGKSTLAFNLYKRGYPLFSDDKCVLKWDRVLRKYVSEPSIRAVRLWQDAMDNMSNTDELIEGVPVIAKNDKYQFNLDQNMNDRLQIVNRIYVIRKMPNIDKISVRRLVNQERVRAIQNQIHRPALIVGDKMKMRHKKFTNNVARLVPIYFVQRPIGIPVHEFIDFMENHINQPI